MSISVGLISPKYVFVALSTFVRMCDSVQMSIYVCLSVGP